LAGNETPLLAVDQVHVFYGRIEALKGVSLEVDRGEFVTLIGANGSGKSTTLKAILGLQPASRGSISFLGREITRTAVESIVTRGIALVPEGRGSLAGMNVAENLELGAYHRRDDTGPDLEKVFQRFPVLAQKQHQLAGSLSGGEQQMLAIARAMMAAPKLLMMDEPSLGLAPIVVGNLFKTITGLRDEGFTILLAEQNAAKALQSADRGYVFETGRIALEGRVEDLRSDPNVRRAYLGGQA